LNDSEDAFGSAEFRVVPLEELNTNVDDVEMIFESVRVKEFGNFVGNEVYFSKRRVLSYQLLEWEGVFDSEISSDVVYIGISWITSQESKGFIS